MISPEIRRYTPQDQPVLEAFLRKVWASNAEIESHSPKQDSVMFLAFEGEQLLGMMTRFERWFHPHTTTLDRSGRGENPNLSGTISRESIPGNQVFA
jgi:hypothetical protein